MLRSISARDATLLITLSDALRRVPQLIRRVRRRRRVHLDARSFSFARKSGTFVERTSVFHGRIERRRRAFELFNCLPVFDGCVARSSFNLINVSL